MALLNCIISLCRSALSSHDAHIADIQLFLFLFLFLLVDLLTDICVAQYVSLTE